MKENLNQILFPKKIYKNEVEKSVENQNEEEFKVKVLVDLYFKMLKLLYFDPCSKQNPSSHMIIYIPRFIEKFSQSLLKPEVNGESFNRTSLLAIVYTVLNSTEVALKTIYKFTQDTKFFLNVDPILGQKSMIQLPTKPVVKESDKTNENIEPDSLEVSKKLIELSSLIKRKDECLSFDFMDFMLEKSWSNLSHYAHKHRGKLESLGSMRRRQVSELNMLIILIQRRIIKYQNTIHAPIHQKTSSIKMSKGDLAYLDLGDVDTAIDHWILELDEIIEASSKIISRTRVLKAQRRQITFFTYKSTNLAHKCLYSLIVNYRIKKLVLFINKYFKKTNLNLFSPFDLSKDTFKHLQPPKPLAKSPHAIVAVIQSLARFMARYFISTMELFIYSPTNPAKMPSLLDLDSNKVNTKVEICKKRLTSIVNGNKEIYGKDSIYFDRDEFDRVDLTTIFTVEKTLELFVASGQFAEAVYFADSINDWKSAFLMTSIFKQRNLLDTLQVRPEEALATRLSKLLGEENFESIIKEVLLCSVLARHNLIEPMLSSLMSDLVRKIAQLTALVPDKFYLPAPPIFCPQMYDDESSETCLRQNISSISRAIIGNYKLRFK